MLGIRVWSLWFQVFGVLGFGFWVLGFRVRVLRFFTVFYGFRVLGSGPKSVGAQNQEHF